MPRLVILGNLLSLTNAFLGSVVFAFLGSPTMLLIAIWDNNHQYGLFDYPFKDFVAIFIFLLVFSFVLSLLPVLIGGCIFISILNRDMKNGSLSTRSAEKLGTLLGLLAGAGLSFMAYILDNYVSQISNGGYFDQVYNPLLVLSVFMTEALIIGSLVGGRTGKQFVARLTMD